MGCLCPRRKAPFSFVFFVFSLPKMSSNPYAKPYLTRSQPRPPILQHAENHRHMMLTGAPHTIFQYFQSLGGHHINRVESFVKPDHGYGLRTNGRFPHVIPLQLVEVFNEGGFVAYITREELPFVWGGSYYIVSIEWHDFNDYDIDSPTILWSEEVLTDSGDEDEEIYMNPTSLL